jgi:hypothetical protein
MEKIDICEEQERALNDLLSFTPARANPDKAAAELLK